MKAILILALLTVTVLDSVYGGFAHQSAPSKRAIDVSYVFKHQGHCAGGWAGKNTVRNSVDDCFNECTNRPNVGYFSFNSKIGKCACYFAEKGCPDDDRHNDYNAFRIIRSGSMTSKKLHSYCAQDWRSDFSRRADNVDEETCIENCMSSASCTGIAWASTDNRASNLCVLCHGTMQHRSHPNWISYDKIPDVFTNPCGRVQIKSPDLIVPQNPPLPPATPEGWTVTWDPEMSRYFFTNSGRTIELTVPEGSNSRPIDRPPPAIPVGKSATWVGNGWNIAEGCNYHYALLDAMIGRNTH